MKMKRGIESTVIWDFGQGIDTNLPPDPKRDTGRAIRLVRVEAVTRWIHTRVGFISFRFDRPFVSVGKGREPAVDALFKLLSQWKVPISAGSAGISEARFGVMIELVNGEHSFCEGATKRAIRMLTDMGVTLDKIPCPDVIQRTHVQAKGGEWMPFGQFIGTKFGLSPDA